MADIGSTPAVYAAMPRLLVDDEETDLLSSSEPRVLVEETATGLYRCELTLPNWGPTEGGGGPDYVFFDRSTFDFGKSIRLVAGAGDTEATVFNGRITALEADYPHARPPELTVLAEDRLQDLRMKRRTRSFEEMSIAQIAEMIASGYNLTPSVSLPEAPTSRTYAQVNQSDLAFLRECAVAVDGEVWVDGTTLHVKPRDQRDAGEVTITYKQGLREFSVMADVARQCTEYVVSGWDSTAKKAIVGQATQSVISNELNGGIAGAATLRQSWGPRRQQMSHTVPLSPEEAEVYAKARFRHQARRFVTGTGVALGDGRIHVGTRLTLQGLGPMFSGAYIVTVARHTYDSQTGYRTQFEVQRPAIDTSS